MPITNTAKSTAKELREFSVMCSGENPTQNEKTFDAISFLILKISELKDEIAVIKEKQAAGNWNG